MKVAVIGAGFFGSTAATMIARLGIEVHLYDKQTSILTSASKTNQLRLHKGYHYPRSAKTVEELQQSLPFFMRMYGEAAYSCKDHLYSIPKQGSNVSPSDFLKFCDEHNLHYKITKDERLKDSELTISVDEKLISYTKIRKIIYKNLRTSGVNLYLGRKFLRHDIEDYDLVVNASYSDINEILEDKHKSNYQFEICEKILVKPPNSLKDLSLVIIDGPFCCIDTFDNSNISLLGNVVHAIHATSVGEHKPFDERTDCGFKNFASTSNFSQFLETGTSFIKDFESCQYLASSFTCRTVLPNVESTDERPTLVKWTGKNILSVFSGKIDTCVLATDRLIKEASL